MIYIGIDPGKDGAMAIIDLDGTAWAVARTEGSYTDTLRDLIDYFQLKPHNMMCFMEKVGAMEGQGVTSMFKFGWEAGFCEGILQAFQIPYQLVSPTKWKKEFGATSDKTTSIEICKKLFPDTCIKKTPRSKDHDGMAEALLIAEFGRRHS